MKMMENQLKENNATEREIFTGIFRDLETKENAYKKLHLTGYTKDNINLVMSVETQKKHFSGDFKESELETNAAEGAVTGSAIGGTVGAIVGVIAAIGTSIAIPGIGIVLAGPIAVGFAGAGVLFHAALLERL